MREREKECGFGEIERWRIFRRSWGRENQNQNILREKSLFLIIRKRMGQMNRIYGGKNVNIEWDKDSMRRRLF